MLSLSFGLVVTQLQLLNHNFSQYGSHFMEDLV